MGALQFLLDFLNQVTGVLVASAIIGFVTIWWRNINSAQRYRHEANLSIQQLKTETLEHINELSAQSRLSNQKLDHIERVLNDPRAGMVPRAEHEQTVAGLQGEIKGLRRRVDRMDQARRHDD